ncbi:hypothetical protein [Saccharopolyspora spinosa]|uniref:Uncharacterized protein n=1 Tax=Saccharopolyspora spinosa TaxID=60894 RepID=A0A2N3XVJ5_SACSN|nr:hypothetical protein [Saccharopolyspora spinosa]PKW14697.1 hypothetical protein A8926_2332 [Saccharopolyspora spinosa]
MTGETWTSPDRVAHMVRHRVTLCGKPVVRGDSDYIARIGCDDCVKKSIAEYATNHDCETHKALSPRQVP